MQLDINIEKLVADSITAALSPEKLQPIIDKNVASAVEGAIGEQFRYNSPFKKLLEESLAGVMPTKLEDVGRYGNLVLKTVTAMLNSHQNQAVQQTITEKLEALLAPLTARMSLSELIEKLTTSLKSSSERDGHDRPTFIIKKSDSITASGYWRLYADAKADVSQYSCKIQMAFSGYGDCYSLRIDDRDPSKSLLLGPACDAEAIVLNLYTGGVKVDFEEIDTDDIYYPDSGFDD
ncbi:hypothetical protein [Agrobacterium tumefaciens]|uniref:hypothetical protein n=1 Tax=Agrobacterium tumefaciens TaxID=358 RepID=UPI0015747B09|nr:hypothetical protein [Agrobacterium tumefaciens]